jgi:hypothetical protein
MIFALVLAFPFGLLWAHGRYVDATEAGDLNDARAARKVLYSGYGLLTLSGSALVVFLIFGP